MPINAALDEARVLPSSVSMRIRESIQLLKSYFIDVYKIYISFLSIDLENRFCPSVGKV